MCTRYAVSTMSETRSAKGNRNLFEIALFNLLFTLVTTFSVSTVRAQSSVTVYGLLDMGLSYQSASANTARTSLAASNFGLISGGQSANLIGFKGREDLGDGNQVTFVLESAYSLGNGSQPEGLDQRLFNRQVWLGIQNASLGYVRVGRQYNFAYDYIAPLTPFAASDFTRASMGSSFASGGTERLSNTIKFETAAEHGFKFGVGYSFSAEIPSAYRPDTMPPSIELDRTRKNYDYNYAMDENLRAVTAGLQYKNGPWYATATVDIFMPNAAVADSSYKNVSSWTFGGYYDFSPFKLSAAYGQVRNGWINALQPLETQTQNVSLNILNNFIVFDQNIAVDSYLLAFTFPTKTAGNVFGAWRLIKPSAHMVESASFSISTQNSLSLGYTYNFTPRTNLYTYVSYTMDYAMIEGLTSFNVAVGLRHAF